MAMRSQRLRPFRRKRKPLPAGSNNDPCADDLSNLPSASEEFKAALWEKIKRPADDLPDYGTWDELEDDDLVPEPSHPRWLGWNVAVSVWGRLSESVVNGARSLADHRPRPG